jgi:hypothetical protein
MALDPSNPSLSPCDLLNSTGFPSLFVSGTDESLVYGRIATGGILKTYSSLLTASTATNSILATANPSSKYRLIQFLSGSSSTAASTGASPGSGPGSGPSMGSGSQTYTTLGSVALKNQSGQYESIIDTYIGPVSNAGGKNYLAPTFTVPDSMMSDTQFWAESDIVDGVPISGPTSVLGKLIKAGHLLSASQVYTPSQFVAGAAIPAANTESLIYLYNLSQKQALSAAQVTLQATLENTNLKFFGAFMAEYCFYRTRYEWLLTKFFAIYSTPTTGTGGYSTMQTAAADALFGGGRAFPSGSSSASLTQSAYIEGLTYQMACLNMRLQHMRTLLSKINTYYNGVFDLIKSDINSASADGSNTKLTQTITALQTSASQANKYLTETDFAQEAMEYNSEKNRYSNILLGLYAFLNIAALATVFQLARS